MGASGRCIDVDGNRPLGHASGASLTQVSSDMVNIVVSPEHADSMHAGR